jgi:alpha-N-arabinofuranosidase
MGRVFFNPFAMFANLVNLIAFLGVIGTAIAGPKRPRSGASLPRATTNSSAVSLNILTNTGIKNATAPYLYGWMFEDINHSGDGGLYGELLTNRAFDGSNVQWGTIPGYTGNSIVSSEDTCNPYGKFQTFESVQS